MRPQATPLVAGLALGAAAFAGKYAIELATKLRAAPPRLRQFYKVRGPFRRGRCVRRGGLAQRSSSCAAQGGFQPQMNRREASMILGVRESAGEDRVKEAHIRVMKANHPDLGGSSYIAEKVNEAKDMLLGNKRRSSVF